MKTILAAVASCMVCFTAAADGPPPPSCPSGTDWLPWHLAAVENAETPIFAGDHNTHTAIVCNCTEPSGKVDPGIWMETLQQNASKPARFFGPTATGRTRAGSGGDSGNLPPPPPAGPGVDVYYLQAAACALVGPGSVILRTADHGAAKWGVWKLEK